MSTMTMEGLSASECPVCFDVLTADERPPLSMPCGHTVCKLCVSRLAAHSAPGQQLAERGFLCPLCRSVVAPREVRLNVTLRDLLVELQQMNAGADSGPPSWPTPEPTTPSLSGRRPSTSATTYDASLNVDFAELELDALLDRGAFAKVHRARWRGSEVAVKVFSVGMCLPPEAKTSFQREVYLMSCLRHPNIVLLMGACQALPRLAIIMEYLAGGSLYTLLHVAKQRLSLEEVQSLGLDMCRGLQYLHSVNILHRDLKSKNVLLTGKLPCQAKLCDFGLSRVRLESTTMTGLIGTTHWTAPEVMNSHRYHFPADVYSLGLVLYEMGCGRIPFHGMETVAVLMAVAVRHEAPPMPPGMEGRLARLVGQCVHWDPQLRPSVADLLAALARLVPIKRTISQAERVATAADSHGRSLGVVFLTARDSAELREQQIHGFPPLLIRMATEDGPYQPAGTDAPHPVGVSVEEGVSVGASPRGELLAPPTPANQPEDRVGGSSSPCPSLHSEENPSSPPPRTPLSLSPDPSDDEGEGQGQGEGVTGARLNPLLIRLTRDVAVDVEGPEDILVQKAQVIQKMFFDAAKRGNVARVRECHERGANLAAPDTSGWTALHHTAQLAHKHVLEYLVQHMPRPCLDVQEPGKQQTALHKAAWYGHRTICRLLVEHGASLTVTDYQGSTPYLKCLQCEDGELQHYLRKKEAAQRAADSAEASLVLSEEGPATPSPGGGTPVT